MELDTTEVQKQIAIIVYHYDQSLLGIPAQKISGLRLAKIKPSQLEYLAPTFLERISLTAWDFCFLSYLKQNPNGNKKDFQAKYVGTLKGHEAYKKALDEVAKILPEKLDVDSVNAFLKSHLSSSDK